MPMTMQINTINQPINATVLENGLKQAMINAGFNNNPHRYNNYGENRLVFVETFNSSTYGKGIAELVIDETSLRCSLDCYLSFDTNTNTGQGWVSGTDSFYPLSSVNINCYAINGGEFKAVIAAQGTTIWWIFQVRPSLKPTFWDENLYPYVWFQSTTYSSSALDSLFCPGDAMVWPFGANNMATFVTRRVSGLLPNNKREISTPLILIVISNKFATFAFTCKPCPGRGYSDDQCLKLLHFPVKRL